MPDLKAIFATGADDVIVFPNNKNLILAAEQADSLSKGARLLVVHAKSIADCYAVLAMVDCEEESAETVAESIGETVLNVETVVITRAAKDASYDALTIRKGDVIAMTGNAVVAVGGSVTVVATSVIDLVMKENERDTVTVFGGSGVTEEAILPLAEHVRERYLYTETDFVETDEYWE